MDSDRISIGGDHAAALRLMEEHNRTARLIREREVAAALADLTHRNGAEMDPRESTKTEPFASNKPMSVE